MSAPAIRKELAALGSPEKAKHLSRFFKTGKGEYGEGDRFLGVTVPEQRKVARKWAGLDREGAAALLDSPFHEHRLTALLILVEQYRKLDGAGMEEMFIFYRSKIPHINNWDLVDLSAPKIPGDFMLRNPESRALLPVMAASDNLWERRIAVLSTYPLIKKAQFGEALTLYRSLLGDGHDLMHKAVGWMLREMGKVDRKAEEEFLEEHRLVMPRTMLRYAIEHFDKAQKAHFMSR